MPSLSNIRPPSGRNPARTRGAVMLVVVMFIMLCAIAFTASISLMGARLQQSERAGMGVQRHVVWGNTRAINQQYAFTWALRDGVTRSLSTATVTGTGYVLASQTGWGGSDADIISSLSAFKSTNRPSNLGTVTYPFNNIINLPTSDNGVFFARTTADSDTSQTEHLYFYNYLKSYPSPLLGDLLIIHKRATAISTGTYYMTDNLQVNGRVVIWDETAESINLRADACLNMTKTGTNTIRDTQATPATRIPQNFPARVTATSGYGGTSAPTAVTNGSLNLITNTDFSPGTIKSTIESSGAQGTTWLVCSTGTNTTTNFNTSGANGTTTSDLQLKMEGTPTYSLPTTSPYGYTASSSLNALYVRLKNSTLKHLRIDSGVEQLVLEGQTNATDYTNAASLSPVIIWVEQLDLRDIRFVGENSRPLILATRGSSGNTTTGTNANIYIYSAFHGSSLVTGGPLRWRLNWINEVRMPYLHIVTSGVNVQLTGSIRTNAPLNCTDTGSTVRFTLQRETTPGNLETMLPRDAWMEPYVLVR